MLFQDAAKHGFAQMALPTSCPLLGSPRRDWQPLTAPMGITSQSPSQRESNESSDNQSMDSAAATRGAPDRDAGPQRRTDPQSSSVLWKRTKLNAPLAIVSEQREPTQCNEELRSTPKDTLIQPTTTAFASAMSPDKRQETQRTSLVLKFERCKETPFEKHPTS